jgi:nicotinamidase-related amidase
MNKEKNMSAVLVLVDLQKEYIAEGRPFCLETSAESLANLRKLQDHARKKGWRVVHMKHQQNSECFTYGSEYSEFIEDFVPIEGELVMAKSDFSCFSSPEFLALVDRYRNKHIIIAGYSATMCCLSTLVDAHHRGYGFTFVTDATCAKRTKRFGEQDMKEHIVDILSAYANLATTEEILAWQDEEKLF